MKKKTNRSNSIKKLVAFALAMMMALSLLVACRGPEEETAAEEAPTEAPVDVAAPVAGAGDDDDDDDAGEEIGGGGDAEDVANGGRTRWSDPFPEMLTVTIANDDFAHIDWREGFDIFNNPWTFRWRELYNVDVETIMVSGDYELMMNLAIAAGDLPDMFNVNSVQFQQLLDANLVQDLSHVLNPDSGYMSPALIQLLEDEPLIVETAMRDGRLYSLPHLHYGDITFPDFMWIRNDWMAEMGNPEIRTIAQFEDLMQRWIDDFDAPYAISMTYALQSFWASTIAWHAHPRSLGTRMWVCDGAGGIMSGYEMPGMIDALEAWARWFDNGWVRPDFATAQWDDWTSDAVSGTVGIEFGPQWRGWVWADITENFGPEVYLYAYDIPSVDGERVNHPIIFANSRYAVVRSDFAHPEILPVLTSDYVFVLTEAALDPNFPREQLEILVSDNDIVHITGPFKMEFPHYYLVLETITAIRTGNDNFTNSFASQMFDDIMMWVVDGDRTGFGRYIQSGHDHASLVVALAYEENDEYVFCKAWGPMPQIVLDFGTITDSIINEGVTRIIMGLEPVDHWYVLLEEWRAAGGDQMRQAINEMYGN